MASAEAGRGGVVSAAFAPTGEQEAIRDAYLEGGPLAVTAGAGTGKTSTLVLLGQAKPARARYIAFNRSIAKEAERKFPKYVRTSTAHSLAFQAVGRYYRDRLDNQKRVPAREIANILKINEPLRLAEHTLAPQQVARLVMETVKHYCYSAAEVPSGEHVPRRPGIKSPEDMEILRQVLIPLAARAWEDIRKPDGRLKFDHDYYLKIWQLSGARIAGDVLFIDECQDLNPVLEAIVARQDAQLVSVGDPAQQLYSWRGATNALPRLGGGRMLTLSQSFRFGPAIAREANKWLGLMGEPLRLSGLDSIPSRVCEVGQPRAILSKSNAGVMKQVIDEVGAGRKVAIPSGKPGKPGGSEIESLARAAQQLKAGRGTDHPELMAFQTWSEVRDYAANDPGGDDLAVLVGLVDEHGAEKILDLTSKLVPEENADVVVSTVHKAKGREWDSVLVTGFKKPGKLPEDDETPLPPADVMRTLYVAKTRAKLELDRGTAAFVDDYLKTAVRA
jgi:superfamily I DNA/RNA helicase